MRISRSVMAVCGVVLAAGLIGFTNPKAVHAVTAALVEVTNTASNPVVSSEATLAPAQLVELLCDVFSPDSTERYGSCRQVSGGRVSTADYVVPSGQTLVLTDIDFNATGGGGSFSTGFYVGTSNVIYCPACGPVAPPILYFVPKDGQTHHFTLGRGVVWPSGTQVEPSAQITFQEGPQAYLHGYLVAN